MSDYHLKKDVLRDDTSDSISISVAFRTTGKFLLEFPLWVLSVRISVGPAFLADVVVPSQSSFLFYGWSLLPWKNALPHLCWVFRAPGVLVFSRMCQAVTPRGLSKPSGSVLAPLWRVGTRIHFPCTTNSFSTSLLPKVHEVLCRVWSTSNKFVEHLFCETRLAKWTKLVEFVWKIVFENWKVVDVLQFLCNHNLHLRRT
jgi:hypothetical protein